VLEAHEKTVVRRHGKCSQELPQNLRIQFCGSAGAVDELRQSHVGYSHTFMVGNQVFLSYALEDADTARHVARAIEERGWALSWERYRNPDAIASLALREALSVADCVVVLWSRHSVRAQEVLDEASLGRAQGNLVQGALDDADVPMPFVLDEPKRLTDHWSVTTLVGQIARVLGGDTATPTQRGVGADSSREVMEAGVLEEAERHADAGELSEAIGLYESWEETAAGTTDLKAVRRLGDLYLAADREEDAARQYVKVAEHLAESGFVVPAIETYRRVVELVPHRDAYRSRLGALEAKDAQNSAVTPLSPLSGVQFTLTAPLYARIGAPFAMDVWAHREQDRGQIAARLDRPSRQAPGGRQALTARLHVDGLDVETREKSLHWRDGIGDASFVVSAPSGAASGGRGGTVTIHFLGLQVARIHFVVQLGETLVPREIIPSRLERLTRAYAVCAPEDFERVRSRIAALETAAPGIEIVLDDGDFSHFLNVLPGRDVFHLFWSQNAARSRDVERQWRYALRARGIDFIDPVPLDPPEVAPPPPELTVLHDGDWQSAYDSAAAKPATHTPPEADLA